MKFPFQKSDTPPDLSNIRNHMEETPRYQDSSSIMDEDATPLMQIDVNFDFDSIPLYEMEITYKSAQEKYKGEVVVLKNGFHARHGHGVMFDSQDRKTFDGYWCKDSKHGFGTEYDPETFNLVYEGYFENDMREGQGTEYRPNGTKLYDGIWHLNQKDVEGIFYCDNGMSIFYRGEITIGGIKEGKGTIYSQSDGSKIYTGYFKFDQKHGEGTLFFYDGRSVYCKTWDRDSLNGQVKYMDPDGTVKECEYQSGNRILDKCKVFWSNGQLRYEGSHRGEDFLPHGEGKWFDIDGKITYEGNFKNGKMHGMGTIYYDKFDPWKRDWFQGAFIDGRENGSGFMKLKDTPHDYYALFEEGGKFRLFVQNEALENGNFQLNHKMTSKSFKEVELEAKKNFIEDDPELKNLVQEKITQAIENNIKEKFLKFKRKVKIEVASNVGPQEIKGIVKPDSDGNSDEEMEEGQSEAEEQFDQDDDDNQKDDEEDLGQDDHNELEDSDVEMEEDEKRFKKNNLEEDIEFLDEGEETTNNFPSYQKFKAFFSQFHPTDISREFFSIWKYTGAYQVNPELDEEEHIVTSVSEVQFQIGLGPSLMLMLTKALTYFFLLMTIIHIPLYACYNFGQGEENQITWETFNLNDVFAKLSLGNIGESLPSCNLANYDSIESFYKQGLVENINSNTFAEGYKPLIFTCPRGQLKNIIKAGFINETHTNKLNCNQVQKRLRSTIETTRNSIILKDKLFENGRNITQMVESNFYSQCSNKDKCDLDLNSYLDARPQPSEVLNFIAVANCSSPFVKIPIFKNDITKVDFGLLIIIFEFVVITIMMRFSILVKQRQEEFVQAFKEKAIEMDDYSLKISDLPPAEEYFGDNQILRALLLFHFQQLLRGIVKLEITAQRNFNVHEAIEEAQDAKKQEVKEPEYNEAEPEKKDEDGFETKRTVTETDNLIQKEKGDTNIETQTEITEETKNNIQKDKEENKTQGTEGKKSEQPPMTWDSQIEQEIEEKMAQYQYNVVDITFAKKSCNDIKLLSKELTDMSKKVKSVNKQYKYKRFQDFMNRKDMEINNFAISEYINTMMKYFKAQKQQAQFMDKYQSPPYAFIVFHSIEAKKKVENLYKLTDFQKFIKNVREWNMEVQHKFFSYLAKQRKNNKHLQGKVDELKQQLHDIEENKKNTNLKMYTLDTTQDVDSMKLEKNSQLIEVTDSGTPDDINWLNMSESPFQVKLRQNITRFICIGLVFGSVSLVIWFNYYMNQPLNINFSDQVVHRSSPESLAFNLSSDLQLNTTEECQQLFLGIKRNETQAQEYKKFAVSQGKDDSQISSAKDGDMRIFVKFIENQTLNYMEKDQKTPWRNCFCNLIWFREKNEIQNLQVNFEGKKQNICKKFIEDFDDRGPLSVFGGLFITAVDTVMKVGLQQIQQLVEKNHNQSDDLIFILNQRLTISFLNFVVIMLIVNLYLESMSWQKYFFQGEYPDFTKKWYFEKGVTLCVTLFLYIGKMHIGNLQKFAIKKFLRWKDRGFKRSLKKSKKGEEAQDGMFEGGRQKELNDRSTTQEDDQIMGDEMEHFYEILKLEDSNQDKKQPFRDPSFQAESEQFNSAKSTCTKIKNQKAIMLSKEDIEKQIKPSESEMTWKQKIQHKINQGFWLNVLPIMKSLVGQEHKSQEFLDQIKKIDINTKILNQEDHEQMYLGDEMKSAELYSDIVLFFITCCTLGCGLPVLYPIGFLFNLTMFWAQKLLILKFYRRATSFNQKLAQQGLSYMGNAVYLHIIFTTLMLSNPEIFGKEENYEQSSLKWGADLMQKIISLLDNRFISRHSIIFVAINLILFIIYVLYQVVIFIWTKCSMLIKESQVMAQDVDLKMDQNNPNNVSNFYKDLSIDQLLSFNKRVKKEKKLVENWLKSVFGETDDDSKNKAEAAKGEAQGVTGNDLEQPQQLVQNQKEKFNDNFTSFVKTRFKEWHDARIVEIKKAIKSHYKELEKHLKLKYQSMLPKMNKMISQKNINKKQKEMQTFIKQTMFVFQKLQQIKFLVDVFASTKKRKTLLEEKMKEMEEQKIINPKKYSVFQAELIRKRDELIKGYNVLIDNHNKQFEQSNAKTQKKDNQLCKIKEDKLEELLVDDRKKKKHKDISQLYNEEDPKTKIDLIKRIRQFYELEILQMMISNPDYKTYNTDKWLQMFMEINEQFNITLNEVFLPEQSFRLINVTQSFHMMDSTTLIKAEKVRLEMLYWYKKINSNQHLLSANAKLFQEIRNRPEASEEKKASQGGLKMIKDKFDKLFKKKNDHELPKDLHGDYELVVIV